MNSPLNDNSQKDLAPPLGEQSFRDHLQKHTFPQGQNKADQLWIMHNQLIDTLEVVMTEQNRKISRLAELLGEKANRKQVEDLVHKVDDVLRELRTRMSNLPGHDHHHPTTPPTVLEMVAAGTATLKSSLEYNDNVLVMCVLRDDGLHLFDVLRDEFGLPRYEVFSKSSDERQLAAAVLAEHRAGGYKPNQLVYITVNLITTEPLDETSVQVPATKQS